MSHHKKNYSYKSIFSLFLITVSLIITLIIFKREEIYQFISEASGQPADLVVETQKPLGELPRIWSHLAQGGENLSADMISPVISEVKALSPQTIRIDHIYDGYDVVNRDASDQLTFNWIKLDKIVQSVTTTGAVPLLALSYMPPAIGSGDIVSPPKNYSDWSLIVQKTVEHYSGDLKIPNVNYEVWNEPDLFGNWKTYGERNYLELYRASAIGAQNAASASGGRILPFKIGGPATTAPYSAWTRNFLNFVQKNNLRLDFFTWHRYSKDLNQFVKDKESVERIIHEFPRTAASLEWYITEVGPDSEVNSIYDGNSAAAHLIAVAKISLGQINRLYTFEIVDGKSPENKEYWGRWGLLTHPDFGASIKPRYQALQLLNKLQGSWLNSTGDGDWVKAIASKTPAGIVQVLIVNYDTYGRHSENVPLAFTDLTPGSYTVSKTLLGGGTNTENINVSLIGLWATKISLSPNSVVLIGLKPAK